MFCRLMERDAFRRVTGALVLGALPVVVWAFAIFGDVGRLAHQPPAAAWAPGDTVILGYNNLGMHCMGDRFDELCILPPANTMRATVIDRSGEEPKVMRTGVTVTYSIPGNTDSTTKTNFWDHAFQLFGVQLPPNVGLFGKGLSGTMDPTADRDFIAEAVPITPRRDDGVIDPYQLATLTATRTDGSSSAVTRTVMPVSWEMRCDLCHTKRGVTVATDILWRHDKLHGTSLMSQKPVLCARCHADPALGASGDPSLPNLSLAMHRSHANRRIKPMLANKCYMCHPGPKTQCMRDMHQEPGQLCSKCHGGMLDVGNPARTPWVDLPKCGSCHHEPGHEYEEPGKLYRNSKGHGGVKCEACHGSPHALYPTTQPNDNVQSIALQGHAGKIDQCLVCHKTQPDDAFWHTRYH